MCCPTNNSQTDCVESFNIVGELLGAGAFGRVFRCVDINSQSKLLKKKIALKCIADPEQNIDSNEVKVHQLLVHTNIVTFLGSFRNHSPIPSLFLKLELCKGGTLADLFRKHSPISEENALWFTYQVLEALEYMHSQGVVHRDIKPDNIFVSSSNNNNNNNNNNTNDLSETMLKIGDFGISQILADEEMICTNFCGTEGYMAPEVLAMQPHSFPVDMWAVGVLLYGLVEECHPFSPDIDGTSDPGSGGKSQSVRYRPPEHLMAGNHLLHRTLRMNPLERLTARRALSHPVFQGAMDNAARLATADSHHHPIEAAGLCYDDDDDDDDDSGPGESLAVYLKRTYGGVSVSVDPVVGHFLHPSVSAATHRSSVDHIQTAGPCTAADNHHNPDKSCRMPIRRCRRSKVRGTHRRRARRTTVNSGRSSSCSRRKAAVVNSGAQAPTETNMYHTVIRCVKVTEKENMADHYYRKLNRQFESFGVFQAVEEPNQLHGAVFSSALQVVWQCFIN